MTTRDPYPERTGGDGNVGKLAWVIACIACGLAIVAAALAYDLHNQKRRTDAIIVQLKQTCDLREAESKNFAARNKVVESAANRLDALYADGQADLKKLNEAYTQREPTVKQATELQTKIQALVNDLIDLAKTDPDARAIAGKYRLQANPVASGPGPAKH